MATPFKLSNYAGTINVGDALKASEVEKAYLFEGIILPFKIATSDSGETTIDIGNLSKKDHEILGERAAADMIQDHLIKALGGVAEKPAKK